ncbi:glycosyltransferase family 9 protein [Shewanella sp. VB17]|uniref:glycosyltransferase family 9 protein n=1 Tax=Shewanella sp. VB17 TaxID=2739432 RepID=UPI0020B72120|nr:glycosyltransferase family 9 protein [Shewanella sp. VB17]
MPEAQIEVFVSPALESLAQACPYIDHVLVDTGDDKAIHAEFADRHYDAVLVSLSQFRIYKIIRHLNIPYMLAPKLNWYQYLYKYTADARYKTGEGCWRGGCMLVKHFLTHHDYTIPELPNLYWNMTAEREKWQNYYNRQDNERLIFVHPGTGGSSGSLSPADFTSLLIKVNELTQINCRFILTYGEDEEKLAQEIFDNLQTQSINVSMAKPLSSLADFAKSIVAADMFIAGSTGPLHIAGLHNIPTVGFYAGRRSAPQVRWQTLTQSHKRLAFTPPVGRKTGRKMSLIDFNTVAAEVSAFLNAHYIK